MNQVQAPLSRHRGGLRLSVDSGYSAAIVVDEAFALRISPRLELAAVAPLLCAGITTYSPLRHWNTKKGDRVGVVGLAWAVAKGMGSARSVTDSGKGISTSA